jgi:uncharacterized protein with PQ loop repeat
MGKKPKISLKNKEHKYIIDRVVMVTGVIGPLASIPQAIQIYTTQDAEGVSLITWSLFILTNGALLVYGLIHRLPPIIVSNICWEVIQVIIVIGIFMYS